MEKFFQGSKPINLGPTTITWHQAITIIVAVLVAIVLRVVLTRMRIGIAIRGAGRRPGALVAQRRPHGLGRR